MITAVYDSNVIISGLLWRGESYLCLIALARSKFVLLTTNDELDSGQQNRSGQRHDDFWKHDTPSNPASTFSW